MRKMVFGTLHTPGWTHYLELSHPNQSAKAFGATEIVADVWDRGGRLVDRHNIPVEETLWRLDPAGRPGETYFVTIEAAFAQERNLHMYGYLHAEEETAVYYPLNAALGSRHIHVWDNVGHFVWGTLSDRYRLRFFVGNPSRWATVEGTLLFLLMEGEEERLKVRLGPKEHTMVDLWPRAGIADAHGIEFASSSKLVTYILGEIRETGSVTFIEHLLERRR